MPMPWRYRHASKDFRAFLDDAKAELELISNNSAYTAIDGVFQTFRRRLTPAQGIAFADHLPAVLAALFLHRWDISRPPLPWADRAALAAEVQALRPDHNLTPLNAIEATARALRAHVNQRDFDNMLATLAPEASAFWHVEGADQITRRIT